MKLQCVPPDSNLEVWPSLASRFRVAYEKTGAPFGELAHDVLNGHALIWVAGDDEIEAVVVTKLGVENGNRVCEVLGMFAAVPGRRWLPCLEIIEQYARDEGCASVSIPRARRGWMRVLDGYRQPFVALAKELN